MELVDLVNLIYERGASLFFGAAFSADSGGPGGKQWLNEIKSKFGKNEILDSFQYLENIIGYDLEKRKEVEEFIKYYLHKIEPNPNQRYLLSIPWKVVLTTNYDHVPDIIERTLDGNREIEIISHRFDEGDIRKQEKLFCFKLFGDYNFNYPDDGFMILTESDRRKSISRIEPYFKLFKELALTGNIIYLGYSFNDKFVYDILDDLSFSWKGKPWNGYAISPHAPSPENIKKMTNFNIIWVEGTIDQFIAELKKKFGENPISYVSQRKLMSLDNVSFDVSREIVLNCRNNMTFINEEIIEPFSQDPKLFYQGIDKSFYPYHMEWDYYRKPELITLNGKTEAKYPFGSEEYVRDRLNSTSFSQNLKIILTGQAGNGKSTQIKRLAYNWYKKGGPVIFIDPKNYRLDNKIIKSFIDEVNLKYEDKVKAEGYKENTLRFLIVADHCSVFIDNVMSLYDYLTSYGYLIDLVVVDRYSKLTYVINQYNFDFTYYLSPTITEEDTALFIQHLKRIKLEIDEERLIENISNKKINESFFALMYLTIKATKLTLKEIIKNEYDSLDVNSKKIYSLVSLFEDLEITPHISLIMKYSKLSYEWIINNIQKGSLSGILIIDEFGYLRSNHKLISEIIDNYEYNSTGKYFSELFDIVGKITIGNAIEEEIFHDLIINKITYPNSDMRINKLKIIELYTRLLEKIETRPLYHHLAMLYLRSGDYENGKYYIKKSYETHHPKFYEPKEFLRDTEGRLEIEKAKQLMEKEPDKAWDHLDKAYSFFESAETDTYFSAPPNQGMVQVYYYQGVLSKDAVKYNLFLLAFSKLTKIYRNVDERRTSIQEIESTLFTDLKKYITLEKVREIYETWGNVEGYSFLAENLIDDKNYEKTHEVLTEGLSKKPTVWMLSIKIKLLKISYPHRYDVLEETISKYNSQNDFDLILAFESAKYLFYIQDYRSSYDLFNKIKIRSESHTNKYIFNTDNILYEKEEPKIFRGILSELPTYTKRGIITCYDIPTRYRDIPVRFSDISYTDVHIKDPVYFSIFFNYTGPQAMRVTKR